MYLIDESYFIKDLVVPNNGFSLDVPNNMGLFDTCIDRYARQLLQNALGNVLFDELDSNIELGNLKPDAEQKWKDLVNGKSYAYRGKNFKWKGLIFTEGAFKGSVLAHYTYYNWHLEKLSIMSGVGEVKAGSINAESVNSTSKSVKIWNEFINMYQGDVFKSSYKLSYVNGVPFHDYFNHSNSSDYVCLLDYLAHNELDYPNALKKVEAEGYENTMGL